MKLLKTVMRIHRAGAASECIQDREVNPLPPYSLERIGRMKNILEATGKEPAWVKYRTQVRDCHPNVLSEARLRFNLDIRRSCLPDR